MRRNDCGHQSHHTHLHVQDLDQFILLVQHEAVVLLQVGLVQLVQLGRLLQLTDPPERLVLRCGKGRLKCDRVISAYPPISAFEL